MREREREGECMYVKYVCVCMHVRERWREGLQIDLCMRMYVGVCMSVYECMYTYVNVCMRLCVCECIYAIMCACKCIYAFVCMQRYV